MATAPQDMQRLVTEVDGWLEMLLPDKALERLQPLLERPDTRSDGLVLRVRACVTLKQHEQALADLAELRTTGYDPEWLDLTEAWCRKRTDDLPASIACMRRLLERNEKSAIGHFNLGCYLALAGDTAAALDEVTLACGLDETFRHLLDQEPDLDRLRKDPRFRELAAQARDGDDADDDGAEDEFVEFEADDDAELDDDFDDDDLDAPDDGDEEDDDGDDGGERGRRT